MSGVYNTTIMLVRPTATDDLDPERSEVEHGPLEVRLSQISAAAAANAVGRVMQETFSVRVSRASLAEIGAEEVRAEWTVRDADGAEYQVAGVRRNVMFATLTLERAR